MASVRIAGLSLFLTMLPLSQSLAQVQTQDEGSQTAVGGTSNEDGIYCRPPQRLNNSRLMGPKVCMPIRRWNALHASGTDVDAHGTVKPVQGLEDFRNLSH